MKDRLEYILFIGLSYLVKVLGLKLSRRLSVILAFFFFFIIPIRKQTTIENLARAFPERSHKEIRRLAFSSYNSFTIALVEILIMPFLSESEMAAMVKCPNKELINEKYNEGKGVILLSAHFGNWEYVAASVSLQVGLPFHVIVKPQRNPYVTQWLDSARTNWINKVVPLGISIRQIFKELKDKKIIAMVADQRGPSDGIRVEFFGRPASVYTGPAILALKTGAPVIYGIAVRQPDYSYESILHEITIDEEGLSNEDKVIALSQKHSSYLEEVIREHPEQWLWMHKRWKY